MSRIRAARTPDPAAIRRELAAFYTEVTDDYEAGGALAGELCSAFEAITNEAHSKKATKRYRRAFAKHLAGCRELLPRIVTADNLASPSAALDLLNNTATECVPTSGRRTYDPAIAFAIHIYSGLYPDRRLASTRGVRNRLRLHLLVLRDLILPLAPGFPEKISESHLAELIAESSKFEASNLEAPNL